MATKKTLTKNKQELKKVIGGALNLRYGGKIKDRASAEKGFDLQPHAAVCLALMASKSLSSSRSIYFQLNEFGFNLLERVESYIFVEFAMESLLKAGFVKLDAVGKREHAESLATREYGLSGVHWTLTHAGAKRIAPLYCSIIGQTSEHQKQAIIDILAANKSAIQKGRAKASSPSDAKAVLATVKKLTDDFKPVLKKAAKRKTA